MRVWKHLSVAMMLVFFATQAEAVTVTVDATDFSPSSPAIHDTVTAYVDAYATDDLTHMEIPANQCTFAWSIAHVYQNGNDVTSNHSLYAASYANDTAQNTSISASFNDSGYWAIEVDCQVTYPDGYTIHFKRQLEAANTLYLATIANNNPILS